ncbi:hypothetical protein I3843_15G109200 [Carya illinoinensis]|uniref:Uncharacterized protein n=1 Tax=Carya illinoinensis TaxID=32201 RepID=A0A922AB60_CARIL|nr:hypothetical protein I3842_15G115200 [Carya illinoinensis]KAG7944578.1 hypothetical protein I3843_15G109200 [Carya illinoinensis]
MVPTEEEVEEFFAILRRMKVAVKYFERSVGGNNGEGWRAALETDEVVVLEELEHEEDQEEGVVVVVHGDDDAEHDEGGAMSMVKQKKNKKIRGVGKRVEESEVLDLNTAAPEEEDPHRLE